MVQHVPRHDLPVDDVRQNMASMVASRNRVVDRLERSEMSRARALEVTLTVAKSLCAEDPDVEEFATWEAWVTAMQVGSAIFTSAAASEGPVACRIGVDGEVRELPATGPQFYLNAGSWVTAWYLATICRENSRLEQLARVPVSFLRESGTQFDEYMYDWVAALQSFWLGHADTMWDKVVAAVTGSDPAVAHIADKELLLKILYPPLELFHLYQRREVERFNEALLNAVTWHKEYWTASEERARSSDGLVALAPLALACMARDAGFPIDVESPYLPMELLQFGWAGEVEP
ncbi:immunity 49 family protein [Streptomyces sp. PsTaAH-124]|uniref:immunity 49 family protein n=1 Tax=Streptomyces sp. PsTaAH-124 TaxID=1157638 RepID=UPI00037D132F|nr:immunity 49 family protein [Streptomyces sp. PsTaAH-124]